MRNDNHDDAPDGSYGLPPFLTADDAVLPTTGERIEEDMDRFLEAEVVLLPVGEVFRFVPVEPHMGSIVLLLYFCNHNPLS